MKLSVFNVASQRTALEHIANLVEKSSVHPLVRETALTLVGSCEDRDDMCEIEAVFGAVKYGDSSVPALKNGLKYVADPRWADHFTAPSRLLEQLRRGVNGGDCLPSETILLGAGYKFVSIQDVQVGDVVMGDGQWTKVTSKWDKGVQDILEFELNNGCVLRCTPEHKVFVVPKKQKLYAGNRSEAYEVRASEVKPGDDLLTAQSVPFGRESLGEDRSFLLGIHIAEGWLNFSKSDGRPLGFGISGLDGWRKEENKHRVADICKRMGIETRWHEKYVHINDEALASWLAPCGHLAPNKRVPSLDLTEDSVRTLLEGLDADADVRDGVFSSTSETLALQYRVLQRMLGRSAHIARVDEHGGLGKNPIYRVTPRSRPDERADGKDIRPHARVKSISEGGVSQTYDIEVEGHRFYLPETDLVVHNCDDHTMLIGALLSALGFRVGARAWGREKGNYSHVYAVVGYPKRAPTKELGLDSTVKESFVGWEPPAGHVLTAWTE